MSSRIVAVISDSNRPINMSVREYGKITDNASRVSGILGNRKTGNVEGSSPISPTVRKSTPK